MAEEEKKVVKGADVPPVPKVPEEPKAPEAPKVPEESPEVLAKAEQLANIKVAVATEEARLREIRRKQKLAKQGIVEDEEEELPQIDMKDPSAQAWDKRIKDTVAPANRELERAKEERRLFTLRQFLSDKPALAKNPEKVKAMMETYDRLKTSTELTSEGIQMDLEKAYAAEHYQELISRDTDRRAETARNDALFSDPAVSRGSTAYSKDVSKPRTYSEKEKAQLAKWGMTPAEHAAMVEEQKKKASVE